MAEDKLERLKKLGGGSKYTIGEVAAAAGCTEVTVRRHIADGKLYSVKVGGRRFIPEETAVKYLKGEPAERY